MIKRTAIVCFVGGITNFVLFVVSALTWTITIDNPDAILPSGLSWWAGISMALFVISFPLAYISGEFH